MTQTRSTAVDLERELAEIDRLIGEAAADGDDAELWRLLKRKLALPVFIKRQRLEPLQARLGRLDDELDAMVAERERVLTEDPPEPPAALRGTVTKLMMRQRVLDGIAGRERAASEDRKRLHAQIAEIEGGAG